ncbi:MAG: hypothetical protein ACM3VV_00020 [Deltaproteobacteria bacterium]
MFAFFSRSKELSDSAYKLLEEKEDEEIVALKIEVIRNKVRIFVILPFNFNK